MLLKTNGEKMPDFRLSMMLMKTNELNHPLHDVDEKKGRYTLGAKLGAGWQAIDSTRQAGDKRLPA